MHPIAAVEMLAPERIVFAASVVACVGVWIISIPVQKRWAERMFGSIGPRAVWSSLAIRMMILLSLLLAAVDLRVEGDRVSVAQPSLQVVCLLDRSRSMLAEDLPGAGSRMDAGKRLIEALLEQSPGTPMALVSFAGDARIEIPLTRDHDQVLAALDRIDPMHNRSHGSNFASAFQRSRECFADRFPGNRWLVVITDGEYPSGVDSPEPVEPIDALTSDFIVVGNSRTGGRIPIPGQTSFLMHNGETVTTVADASAVERLANKIGGHVLQIESGDALMSAEEELAEAARNRLADSVPDATKLSVSLAKPLATGFLFVALVFSLLEIVPSSSLANWRRTLRRAVVTSSVLIALGLVAGAGTGEEVFKAGTPQLSYRERVLRFNQAVSAYQNQDYLQAERGFRAGLDDADPQLRRRSTFNLANTLYRSVGSVAMSKQQAIGRLQQAVTAYRRCIALGHRPEDASANRRLARRLIEQIQRQVPDSSERPERPGGDDAQDDDAQDDESPAPGGEGSDPNDNESTSPEQDNDSGEPERGPSGSGPSGSAAPDRSDSPSESPANDNAPGGQGSGSGDRAGANRPEDSPIPQIGDQRAEELLDDIRRRAETRRARTSGSQPAQTSPAESSNIMPW
ncbi:VWA domain-containing protein [Roseiconus nitratireducens]|uniref:VWA domain-containing protein n=1 Tax=Roseiconus nitratireducens TaxID=2605748 RepID=A0A5M6D418_9BACT|nr:VWA domain-containing protein [Roseiconus nitratireducens]KAA5542257.1 VWA domain-containing protein [Roseiconus nitratireducens]